MRPLSFEQDLTRSISQATPSMLFDGTTPDELRDWQRRFRTKLAELLGPIPERGELQLRYECETDCGSYVRHRIWYQTESEMLVPAYLLVPKDLSEGEKRPGILCIHGHGSYGKDNVVGIRSSAARREEIEKYGYDFAHRFAEQGYVVLAPDLRGFGERRPNYPAPSVDYCPRNYMCATLLGMTVVGMHLCDLGAALDVLQSLEIVDGEMLACAGLSLGGRMTMVLSAMDQRVKVAIPSGCMNLYQERYQAMVQCGAQLIPGLLVFGDTPEIFSLIAPRPMVIEIGVRDPVIPAEWCARGVERVQRAYKAAGASDNLHIHRFDAEHIFHGGVASEVLRRWREGESQA